jgi:hypothetical protein
MSVTKDKVLVDFNTNEISVYSLKDNTLKMLSKDNTLKMLSDEDIDFKESPVTEIILKKIDMFLDNLSECAGGVDNERIRLYVTGRFQKFSQSDKTKLINYIYVNHGLYFNIVQPELEQFYLEQSMSIYGSKNIIAGLVHQEFRKVVVCGSFQQHLKYLDDVITVLHKHNITVLSPWTTKIVPETSGTDFILLEGQEPLKNKRDTWTHRYKHMDQFRQSDAIIVCNPNGYIGKGAMFELGFMVAISNRIIFTEQPQDLSVPFPYEIGLNF